MRLFPPLWYKFLVKIQTKMFGRYLSIYFSSTFDIYLYTWDIYASVILPWKIPCCLYFDSLLAFLSAPSTFMKLFPILIFMLTLTCLKRILVAFILIVYLPPNLHIWNFFLYCRGEKNAGAVRVSPGSPTPRTSARHQAVRQKYRHCPAGQQAAAGDHSG